MRGHVVTFVAFSTTIITPMLAARSDEIPTLKVEPLCHGIVTQGLDPMAGGEPSVSYARCIEAEGADRQTLKKEWSTFSTDDKRHCVALATMGGGESSYTELVTCLEMARDVKLLRSSPSSKADVEAKPSH
jgi:hypothetical protein